LHHSRSLHGIVVVVKEAAVPSVEHPPRQLRHCVLRIADSSFPIPHSRRPSTRTTTQHAPPPTHTSVPAATYPNPRRRSPEKSRQPTRPEHIPQEVGHSLHRGHRARSNTEYSTVNTELRTEDKPRRLLCMILHSAFRIPYSVFSIPLVSAVQTVGCSMHTTLPFPFRLKFSGKGRGERPLCQKRSSPHILSPLAKERGRTSGLRVRRHRITKPMRTTRQQHSQCCVPRRGTRCPAVARVSSTGSPPT